MALAVTDDIPYGNVCDVNIRQRRDVCEVEFAASAHGGAERLWFCMRLQQEGGKTSASRLRLVLKHVTSMLGCHKPELIRPVARTGGGDWSRMGPGSVETTEDGRIRIAWELEAPVSFMDIAFCYPYGRPDLETLISDTDCYWRAETIGVSQCDRPIMRLSNDSGQEGGERPGLYFIARQHSAETPGSWVLDGVLRQLADCEDAPLVWAVPLSNIDGVEQGDYGKDNFPWDVNRAWGEVPMRHETVAIQRDLAAWTKRCRPMLGLDFHAPCGTEYDGAYTFIPKQTNFPELHEQTRQWTERIRVALGEYAAPKFTRTADYASRWQLPDLTTGSWYTPNFTRYCASHLQMPVFTLETPYALIGDILMGREQYRELGGRIAHELVELCRERREQ